MGNAKRGGEAESVVKRILDGMVLRHPVVSAVAALALVLAVGGGAAGLGADDAAPRGGSSGSAAAASGAPDAPGAFERAEVVRVVDGDTLVVSVGGQEQRVRMIGIDCPESVAPQEERNTPEGARASEFTKGLVGPGDAVWLERDVSDVDQYGRLLRYVWLEQPIDPDDVEEVRDKMLGGILVREGYAQARRYGDDTAHAEALEALGREASRAGRGVSSSWG